MLDSTMAAKTYLLLSSLVLGASAATNFNVSGEGLAERYWNCCKPSCGWKFKADVFEPVKTCSKNGGFADVNAGTGCNGGDSFQCADYHPWAVNDTFSYGFAGAYITPQLTGGGVEDAWCCACYQLDFTSDDLKGKSMIVHITDTTYDITSANLFSLAIPGGNYTTEDKTNACAVQYGVSSTVFGQNRTGVATKDDCQNLPQALREGCQWRFDWFKDATHPTLKFKRVACPAELTNKTGCVRKDDEEIATGKKGAASAASSVVPAVSAMAVVAGLLALLSV